MFWVSCLCWSLCKAMAIWSVSGILHRTPLAHVRDATRAVRSAWGHNPQTAFSVIHISTCYAPRMNALALVLSTTMKARTTTSVKDATLPAELVKVKAYTLLWPKTGLSKHLPTLWFCFFPSLLQDLETLLKETNHIQRYQPAHDLQWVTQTFPGGCWAPPGPGWLVSLVAPCCHLTLRVLIDRDGCKDMNSFQAPCRGWLHPQSTSVKAHGEGWEWVPVPSQWRETNWQR